MCPGCRPPSAWSGLDYGRHTLLRWAQPAAEGVRPEEKTVIKKGPRRQPRNSTTWEGSRTRRMVGVRRLGPSVKGTPGGGQSHPGG
mmetsp:Transcript_12304/g.22349  ORF Transcript_12304/g.22349 Transcript_12304/m.22349 type:complete len:86 (-) Transcript_12304:635-892(-)